MNSGTAWPAFPGCLVAHMYVHLETSYQDRGLPRTNCFRSAQEERPEAQTIAEESRPASHRHGQSPALLLCDDVHANLTATVMTPLFQLTRTNE